MESVEEVSFSLFTNVVQGRRYFCLHVSLYTVVLARFGCRLLFDHTLVAEMNELFRRQRPWIKNPFEGRTNHSWNKNKSGLLPLKKSGENMTTCWNVGIFNKVPPSTWRQIWLVIVSHWSSRDGLKLEKRFSLEKWFFWYRFLFYCYYFSREQSNPKPKETLKRVGFEKVIQIHIRQKKKSSFLNWILLYDVTKNETHLF